MQRMIGAHLVFWELRSDPIIHIDVRVEGPDTTGIVAGAMDHLAACHPKLLVASLLFGRETYRDCDRFRLGFRVEGPKRTLDKYLLAIANGRLFGPPDLELDAAHECMATATSQITLGTKHIECSLVTKDAPRIVRTVAHRVVKRRGNFEFIRALTEDKADRRTFNMWSLIDVPGDDAALLCHELRSLAVSTGYDRVTARIIDSMSTNAA